MLLTIDVGNTNTMLGLYADASLGPHWRLATEHERMPDEYAMQLISLLTYVGVDVGEIHGVALASGVPVLTTRWVEVCRRYLKTEPLVIHGRMKTGLTILYDNPDAVGADRVVDAVAAYTFYGGPLCIVDFGTATTFDVVLAPNVYLGGIIIPGITISLDSLVSRTAKLPKVELSHVERIVGRNTSESIRSGMLHGTGALVDELVDRICEEQQIEPTVLATGGFAELVRDYSRRIQFVEPDLTLHGLRLIWERNK